MFIDHYNNRDTWLCCCEATKRIYGTNHTSKDRDNLIRAIKKFDIGIREIDSLNPEGIKKAG
jgi:hypothetical protein